LSAHVRKILADHVRRGAEQLNAAGAAA
jgi:hypothetical protein